MRTARRQLVRECARRLHTLIGLDRYAVTGGQARWSRRGRSVLRLAGLLLQRAGRRLDGTAMQAARAASADAERLRSAQLDVVTRSIGDAWVETGYYDDAEKYMDEMWANLFPYIHGANHSVVVDLAAGHGRNSSKLLTICDHLYIVDINTENIEFCRGRFGDDPRITYIVNDGLTLAGIPDASVTLIWCNDAMVHFDSDTVRSYLHEFLRVLVPGGRGLCHHSNYTGNPGGDWQQNPHWRNFMSKELFAHYAAKAGLTMLRQDVSDWGPESPDLDCYSTFERPA
jgi:ubiquinone/menaquinone biosynthesis C-methylase UbiE